MSIFICSGHNWRSEEGKPCPRCLEQGLVQPIGDEEKYLSDEMPCKVETDGGFTRYGLNPWWLPLGKDIIVEGSFEYIE